MITLTLFQASTLLTAVVSLFLGFFVYFGGEKTKLNFSWLLNSVAISAWSIGLFGVVFSTTKSSAWFWQHILDIGGICVPILFFNFVLYLVKKEKKTLWIQFFSLIIGTGLLILSFTDLFKIGVSPKFGINFWIDPGTIYFLFPIFFVFFVFLSTFILIKEYRKADDKDYKRRLLYVLIAQIFGFGGGVTNFFPQLFNVYPFGNYFVILYVIFISYAALKHHLFDMRVIATELLTFTIWAFLSVRTLLSQSREDLLLNVLILVPVIIAGTLLIRSVLREVRQKEKIEKLNKELERAYEIEKRANEELEKLDKYKNDFLVQTQHDLRSPLGVLMGYSDLLIAGSYGKVTKQTKEILGKMQEVIQEKIRDVNNFLDIEQFRMGKGVVSLKPGVEITPILESVVNSLTSKAQAKGIYLNFEKPEENKNILVSADPEKLKSSIYNIVDNAVKYTNGGGVVIKLLIANGKVQIEIKDTGIGIPKDKLENIFEAQFERTVQAKKTAEGSGTGLYLSAQIIKMHNGKIWAESEGNGKGTTVCIELPVN
jgi:signal transduction histidine kinase